MRILLIVVLTSVFFSCNKTDSKIEELEGRWNWVECRGGASGGFLSSPESTGMTRTLEVTSERMKRFEDGVLIFDLAYTYIGMEPSNGVYISLELENGDKVSYRFENGNLIVPEALENCEYEKIN